MRFLERLNPNATREGLKRHALGGAIAAAILGGMWSYHVGMPTLAVFLTVPLMAVSGALAAGAIYWQVEDDSDDDQPEATPDRDDR